MKKSILIGGLAALLALGVAISPMPALAQNTNANANSNTNTAKAKEAPTEKKAGSKDAAEKKSAGPFHGKLASVDKAGRTITVGKRTFQVTSETKIHKAGKPATFDDGVVGDEVSGYVKPTDDGKWLATTVNFGPKPDTKGSEKSAEKKKEK